MMRLTRFLLLLMLAGSAAAAEDAQKTSTTNALPESGTVTIKDVFTRGGKTNLVRDINLKHGAVQIRVHRIYHQGKLLCMIDYMPEYGQSITVESGSPFGLHFLNSEGDIFKQLVIESPEGELVEGFVGTNGVYRPMTTAELKTNWIGEHGE